MKIFIGSHKITSEEGDDDLNYAMRHIREQMSDEVKKELIESARDRDNKAYFEVKKGSKRMTLYIDHDRSRGTYELKKTEE